MKKLRVSRPGRESTDIHGPRRTGSAMAGGQVEQHPDPRLSSRDARYLQPASRATGDGAEHPPYHPGRILKCPVCSVDMTIRYLGAVEIDQCPKCLGVFLDRGELKELVGLSPSSFQSSAPSGGALIYTPHGLSSHVWEHEPEKSDPQ